jgi:trk system potassium uptake protein TrkA
MRKKFAVLGLGHFGMNLSVELTDRGAEVLAIDNNEDHVEKLRDRVAHAVVADVKDLNALRVLGLEDMDAAVVAIGEDFESSLLATAHLQEIGVKQIHNRVVSPIHERILRMMRIDSLILPEADAAAQNANRLMMRGVLDCLQLTDEFSIIEVKVPKAFIAKTVAEVDLRKKFNLNLVTIIRKHSTGGLLSLGEKDRVEVLGVPDITFVFSEKDILVVFGQEKDFERLPE